MLVDRQFFYKIAPNKHQTVYLPILVCWRNRRRHGLDRQSFFVIQTVNHWAAISDLSVSECPPYRGYLAIDKLPSDVVTKLS